MHDNDVDATSSTSELTELGVAGAAAAIRNGDLTSEEYSEALLRQAQQYSHLNSFITIDEAAVRTAAAAADKARAAGSSAPLLGVPVGVKDSYTTAGLRTTLGVGILATFTPANDAEIVAAIKAAGGIVFGKNNLVEMSYGLTGSNRSFGQVKNPYRTDHVSGGSSSGSAAAVAARIVPAAFGGDTVGSIRVPASLSGVVGFKPTTGRWPAGGVAPISPTLDAPGILARTVEDVQLLDQIVTDEAIAAHRSGSGLAGARFAYAPRHYLGLVDPEIEVHFKDALRCLRDNGAQVAEIDLGEDFSVLADRLTWNLFFRETMESVSAFLRRNDFPVSFDEIYHDLSPELGAVWRDLVVPGGRGFLSPESYLSVDRVELQRRFDEVFTRGGFDALLYPTTPTAAPAIAEQTTFTIAGEEVNHLFLAKHTVPVSGAGLPGISIPMGLTGSGLPTGLEIAAAPNRDTHLLALAHHIQSALVAPPSPT